MTVETAFNVIQQLQLSDKEMRQLSRRLNGTLEENPKRSKNKDKEWAMRHFKNVLKRTAAKHNSL